MELCMEPKPESLWWTCTYKEEEEITLQVGSRGKMWELPFVEEFDVLGYRYHRSGKGTHGVQKTLCKGMGSWWRDHFIYRARNVPLLTKCRRIISHVFSTAVNGSLNWSWTVETSRIVRQWETKILRLTLRPKMLPDEDWVAYRRRAVQVMKQKWKKMGLTMLPDLCAEKLWKSMSWVNYDGTVPILKALRAVITRSAKGMSEDPENVTGWRHKLGFHNKGITWDTPMTRWAGVDNDWIRLWKTGPHKKKDVISSLLQTIHLSSRWTKGGDGGIPLKKARYLDPLIIDPPSCAYGTELIIRGDSKTIVELGQWKV